MCVHAVHVHGCLCTSDVHLYVYAFIPFFLYASVGKSASPCTQRHVHTSVLVCPACAQGFLCSDFKLMWDKHKSGMPKGNCGTPQNWDPRTSQIFPQHQSFSSRKGAKWCCSRSCARLRLTHEDGRNTAKSLLQQQESAPSSCSNDWFAAVYLRENATKIHSRAFFVCLGSGVWGGCGKFCPIFQPHMWVKRLPYPPMYKTHLFVPKLSAKSRGGSTWVWDCCIWF